MKKFYFIFFTFFTFQNLFFAQVINLGSLVNFVLFTSNGAVSNVGTSTLTGNIGADIGAISGFESATVSGTFNNIDEVTELAKNDLDLFYNQLTTFPVTNDVHLSALGSSEVLTAGVFLISSAGSIAGNLTLDGQGDSNSIFIFKIVGAFTTGISSNIILINNAFACNIYWLVDGAISIGATSTMKGTFVSNNGAISMASGGNLEGRIFSTTGAIAIDQIVATKLNGCTIYSAIPLPVELLSFTADCSENLVTLNWSTGSENNNNFFTVESSRDGINWNNIGHVIAAGNSSSTTNYSLVDLTQYFGISYYRLKQTDFDGAIRIFSPISIEKCFYSETDLTIFPNPVKSTFKIDFKGNKEDVLSVSVCDIHGKFIYSSAIFNSEIRLENVNDGIYFLHLVLKTKRLTRKFSVVN
jgi:hypothetical protein